VHRHDIEAEALEGLIEQHHIVVRIGEPADLGRIGIVADQQGNAGLRPRMRWQ
jgi:hypothetical protein